MRLREKAELGWRAPAATAERLRRGYGIQRPGQPWVSDGIRIPLRLSEKIVPARTEEKLSARE